MTTLSSLQLLARAIALADETANPLAPALAYASSGWPLFPCSPTDKSPLTRFGFKDATTEIAQLRKWWEKWPDAMIGLRTGREAGVFVLDVDRDETSGIDGFVALAALEKRYGNLPETLRSTTPRGGSHYFFSWRDGIKNSAGRLGAGLDVRGDGGYVILPPSHRADGQGYDWAETSAPTPIEAPQWFVDGLLAPKEKAAPQPQSQSNTRQDGNGSKAYERAALERECAAVATAPPGQRNETLNRAAFNLGQLVAGGFLSKDEMRDRLYCSAVACRLVDDDGIAAVRATIESGLTAGLKEPRAIPKSGGSHGVDGAIDSAAKKAADPPLAFCDIGAWAAQEAPPREWAVPDRFPLRNVALLSGEGSVGKTIVLMQLHAAHVLEKAWLDAIPAPGPTIYFNAEDEEGELHRRFASIAAYYDATLTDLKNGGLNVVSHAGHDAVLGWSDRNGIIRSTPLFKQLKEAASDIQPKLIGLDTAADIFAGNENDRTQVRQFIGLLRTLAIAANAAVIVCAHPSLTGINTGSGLSGSTAWHNSVRARAYLRHVKTDDGIEPDQTLRQLEFMKSNYGPIAATTTLRWKDQIFVLEPKAGSLEKLASDAKAETVFLELLNRFTKEGRTVGDKNGHCYAPAQFAKEPEAKNAGLLKEALANAMRRLFAQNKIHVETYGRPSNPHGRIAVGPPP